MATPRSDPRVRPARLSQLQAKSQPFHSTSKMALLDGAPSYSSMQGKLEPSILEALDAMQYTHMTPVQSKVLSALPTLRSDCLVQAKTGTGKTIAFLLPILQSLLTTPSLPRGQVAVLILSPTRELALQIAKECDNLTSHLRMRIECHTAFGGTARASNLKKFLDGSPSVLVATPGRLKDYLSEQPTLARFANLRTLVLDEADTMLEQGFLQDVRAILTLLPPKSRGWQGMCFSATVPDKIKDVINIVLAPGYSKISTVDKSEPPTHARVPQYHVIIPSVGDTLAKLLSLLRFEYSQSPTNCKLIVFATTANIAALFAEVYQPGKSGLPLKVYELHSRLSQSVRTRTTDAFKQASSGIMFATDVIGRGMDFPDVTSVIQVGLPSNGEQYVHRVGRTARVDKDGRAVILLTEAEKFFIPTNPQLPIRPYAHTTEINEDREAARVISNIMTGVDERTKQKAYSAYLGFMKVFMNKLKMKPEALVALANEFAIKGMGCPEPPEMEKRTIGKMGLKGVRGIRYAAPTTTNEAGNGPGATHRGGAQKRRKVLGNNSQ